MERKNFRAVLTQHLNTKIPGRDWSALSHVSMQMIRRWKTDGMPHENHMACAKGRSVKGMMLDKYLQ